MRGPGVSIVGRLPASSCPSAAGLDALHLDMSSPFPSHTQTQSSVAHPLLFGTRSSSSPLHCLPVRQSPKHATENHNYADEMEYVISRCTSPTPYSLPPTKTSNLSFLRISHAVSGHLRLQSNSSTTLSGAKQLPPSTGRMSFRRVLHWLVPCISGSHHDHLDNDASEKRTDLDKPLRDSSLSEAKLAEKMLGGQGLTRKDAHKEQSSPLSLARLETIEEREEEHI